MAKHKRLRPDGALYCHTALKDAGIKGPEVYNVHLPGFCGPDVAPEQRMEAVGQEEHALCYVSGRPEHFLSPVQDILTLLIQHGFDDLVEGGSILVFGP